MSDWYVAPSRIGWLDHALVNHNNIAAVSKRDNLVSDVVRNDGVELVVICQDEYAFGEAVLERILKKYPDVNFIYIGGNWNGYTPAAKELCLDRKIGLYNSSELSGGLWKKQFWDYLKKDDKGNPEYFYRSA
jgi:hypothetical protein